MLSDDLDAASTRAKNDSNAARTEVVPGLVAEVRRLRAAIEKATQLCYAHPCLADEIRALAGPALADQGETSEARS